MGVDHKEIYASGFVVRVGDAKTPFRPAKSVGYHFVASGKKPRVECGVITDSDQVIRVAAFAHLPSY